MIALTLGLAIGIVIGFVLGVAAANIKDPGDGA